MITNLFAFVHSQHFLTISNWQNCRKVFSIKEYISLTEPSRHAFRTLSAHLRTFRTNSALSAPSVLSTPSTLCTLCPLSPAPSALSVPSELSAPPHSQPPPSSGPHPLHSLHSLNSLCANIARGIVSHPLAVHFFSSVQIRCRAPNQSYEIFYDLFARTTVDRSESAWWHCALPSGTSGARRSL